MRDPEEPTATAALPVRPYLAHTIPPHKNVTSSIVLRQGEPLLWLLGPDDRSTSVLFEPGGLSAQLWIFHGDGGHYPLKISPRFDA